MTTRILAKTLLVSGALLSAPVSLLAAEANTTDILIDVLVRKGILTDSEAKEIRQEVEAVAAAQQAEVVETTVAEAAVGAVPMPKALGGLKLYGDARFRYQAEDIDDADTRSRWRYRARLGADYDFRESPFSMGMRLETGEANDSTNADWGGYFDKSSDELRLGLVYLNYADEDMSLSLGKHTHPFAISSAFWDSDVNPEGLSESFRLGANLNLNFGQYVIDNEREDRGGSDDYLFVGQVEWTNDSGLLLAPIVMASTDGTSEVSETGEFAGENAITDFRDFFVVALPAEYSFKDNNDVRHKIFGTVGKNLDGGDAVNRIGSPYYDPDTNEDRDLFFNLGYTYGSAKGTGTWQAGIEYRYIEGAAFTPNLSDSDFAKNSNNHEGFLLAYKYAFTDFLVGGITYMDSDTIDDGYDAEVVAKEDVKLLQVDAAVKF